MGGQCPPFLAYEREQKESMITEWMLESKRERERERKGMRKEAWDEGNQ